MDLDQEADFVGKEALKRIKAAGITRKMVGLELSGPPLAAASENPWPVLTTEGATVGRMPSCVYSPRLKQNIGMGLIDLAHTDVGTPLVIATPEGERPAEVAALPFFDPKKQLPSG